MGYCIRVVSRFLSRRFHPKSRRLFPFYFFNITLKTDLLTFEVAGAVFEIAVKCAGCRLILTTLLHTNYIQNCFQLVINPY